MRQVPQYLIIGNGRVARHFRHYLNLLNIPHFHWHRAEGDARLKTLAQDASHILVLISDGAIEPFIAAHLADVPAVKIHFSGALVTGAAFGAHPLMTFNTGVYTLDKYKAFPFVVDAGAPDGLLPGIPNAQLRLNPALKAKYHAMCVLSGNFSCLLWQKFFDTLEKEFHLPAEAGHAYLQQQMENLVTDYKTAFTGPLARGDRATVAKNLTALEGDAFQRIYQSFVDLKEKQV